MNIVDEIERRSDARRPALVAGGVTVTYGDLLARAAAVAEWLRGCEGFRGVVAPRVGLACGNGIEYIGLALGILKAGGCLVPVAGELTEVERRELAVRTALHGVLAGSGEIWRGEQSAETFGDACWVPLGEWRGAGFPEGEFAEIGPAFIRFSSGTTGRSKGVVIGHQSLHDRVVAANEALRIGADDRVLWMLPMAHHFAVSIVLYLYHGACTVIEESHLAEDALAAAEREGATVVYGAPFHFAMLAADGGGFRWPALRLAVSTAAPLPMATADAFRRRFGKPLVQGMGVIEVGLPLMNVAGAEDAPASVGLPLPAFRVELRGDDGLPVAAGAAGELWVSGPGMFDAYLSPWQTREEVCERGWFGTGDLAETDAAGRIYLRGRKKSVLNVGGMKVFPEEIEQIIDRHPAVRQSRVTARAHSVLGTVPVADVVLRAGAAADARELIAWCRESLSAHKVPVAVRLVDAVPLTASGKVKR
jgi:long-chain acyl-CoA synthetase